MKFLKSPYKYKKKERKIQKQTTHKQEVRKQKKVEGRGDRNCKLSREEEDEGATKRKRHPRDEVSRVAAKRCV